MRIGGYEIGLFYARKVEQPAAQRGLDLTNPGVAAYLGLTAYSPGGTQISNDIVLTIPPAWSAIRYISEGIASLGRGVFSRQSDGDVFPDHNSPVSYLVDGRPHPHYSMFDFLQTLVSNACMGNGFARIHFDPVTARPTALELIPQEYVAVLYSPSGQLFYHISGVLDNQAVNVYLPETEMIHIKGVTFTGLMGKRVSFVHQSSFSLGVNSAKYSETYFEKGASVGGLITFPNVLSKDQRDILKTKLTEQHLGGKNAGSIMVLDAGADFKPMQAGPENSKVIDFANLSTVEVSQIFKVPLHLLSQLDRSTFSNMEQQNQDFVVHCLRPWAKKIEEEFNSKLFTTSENRTRRKFFAFDLDAMMMGDMQAQAAFFSSAIQNGWMTPNEIRAKKNMNKIGGGETLFIQQNMSPMELLGEILQGKNNGQETQTPGIEADVPDAQGIDSAAANEQPAAAA
ncbi:MAG: phage portal protein [Chitinophagaceae bacterium]|nr:phage portal protein [Chitinophagaceae bacterium]